MEKIDNRKITPLLLQPVRQIKLCTNKSCTSFFVQWELQLICTENHEKLHAFRMKHGFLPILGKYSPGLCLIIIQGRNKLICYCALGTVLLFAKNWLKLHIFGLGVTQESTHIKTFVRFTGFLHWFFCVA